VPAAASVSPPDIVSADSSGAIARRGRLSRAAEFDAVHQLGRSVAGRHLTLRFRSREESGEPRVGYAVPRKVGSAVDRNLVKRRMKEAVSRRHELLQPGTDYVLIARPGLATAAETHGFDWLCDQIAELLTNARSEPRS
jgi:ribonuclease P protein component